MMASSAALLAVRAVHSDLQTPVADFLTVVQAGLTGAPRHATCSLHQRTVPFMLKYGNYLCLQVETHVVDLQLGSRSITTL